MSSKILIIDLHKIINSSADTIRRHKKYGTSLTDISKGSLSLKVLSPGRNFSAKPIVILFFLIELRNYLRINSSKISLLVCGDPWVTLWVAILASRLSKTSFPIQVQFHGDFGSAQWKSQNLTNRIKYKLIFLHFREIVGLRFVDKTQYKNLRNKISSRHLIQIVPVPLSIECYESNFESFKRVIKKDNLTKLLFVGRLEKDRGIKNLYKILSILNVSKARFSIFIAGEGSKKYEMSELSNKKYTNLNIEVLGYVTGRKLVKLYKEADLFLSLAESESYGRSARESLLCGTPILAISSTGIAQLKKEVRGNAVTILAGDVDSSNLPNLIYKAASKKVNRRTINQMRQFEGVKVKALIDGWIEMLELLKLKN